MHDIHNDTHLSVLDLGWQCATTQTIGLMYSGGISTKLKEPWMTAEIKWDGGT
jgi:hypothetical protein